MVDLASVPGCSFIPCLLFPQEDCDLENVWLMGGLSVLTSVPGGPPMVCLLCASKGLHEVGSPPFSIAPSPQWPLLPDSWALRISSSGLSLCPSFTVPAPSWCSAKSAVTLSTHSAWKRPSGPCPNIMTPGAAAVASSAMSVGARAGDLRFEHGPRG